MARIPPLSGTQLQAALRRAGARVRPAPRRDGGARNGALEQQIRSLGKQRLHRHRRVRLARKQGPPVLLRRVRHARNPVRAASPHLEHEARARGTGHRSPPGCVRLRRRTGACISRGGGGAKPRCGQPGRLPRRSHAPHRRKPIGVHGRAGRHEGLRAGGARMRELRGGPEARAWPERHRGATKPRLH